ncbi:MAG: rhodanese-like domain-containing protein [Candidatus Hodarchaeales archaeon]
MIVFLSLPFILGILAGIFLIMNSYPDISYPSLSPLEVYQHVQENDAVIIDTRPWSYWNASRVPGSLWITVDNITASQYLLPSNKSSLIISYCDCSAGGSAIALLRELEDLGYTNLAYMKGTFTNDWKNEGELPFESGPAVQYLDPASIKLWKKRNLR